MSSKTTRIYLPFQCHACKFVLGFVVQREGVIMLQAGLVALTHMSAPCPVCGEMLEWRPPKGKTFVDLIDIVQKRGAFGHRPKREKGLQPGSIH